jgi:putative FmdB family regulatory protein
VPIYTYECQSCGSSLERRQSFNDDPLKTHDDCGGNLRRVIHPAGIVFKGSGFYNTDYKNGTGAKKESESTDSKTDAAKPDAAKSDSTASTSASSNGSTSGGDSTASKSESKSESKSASPAATTP